MKIKDTNGKVIDSGVDSDTPAEYFDETSDNPNIDTGAVGPTLAELKGVPVMESTIPPLAGIKEDNTPVVPKAQPDKIVVEHKEEVKENVYVPKERKVNQIETPIKEVETLEILRKKVKSLEDRVNTLEKKIKDYIDMIN